MLRIDASMAGVPPAQLSVEQHSLLNNIGIMQPTFDTDMWTNPNFAMSLRSAEEIRMMLQTIWSPAVSSGVPAVDMLQQDFFEALDKISSSSDREFCAGYLAFIERIEQIFRQEDQLMDEIDFPGFKSHQEQHARVLGALHNTFACVMDGDLALGRNVVTVLLPQWFVFHMATMDTALAVALQLAQAESAKSNRSDLLADSLIAPL